MKIFFITKQYSNLADDQSLILENIKIALLKYDFIKETLNPNEADALIIQEKISFKDFRYIKELLKDSFIVRYLPKIFTFNGDDCATTLLRGLYTSVPKSRLSPKYNSSVPFGNYYNELVFSGHHDEVKPIYLAGWRGNSFSNSIRKKMATVIESKTDCKIELTESWLNHEKDEKNEFVNLILESKFSLCPGGWAPTSYRIYESMALGRCPVIIADNFAPPQGPNWNEFALFFPERKIKKLHLFLLEHEPLYMKLGLKAKEAWNNFFRLEIIADYYAKSLIEIISSSPECSMKTEIKRWNSLKFYWNNNWTLPQRVSNKIKQKII